MDKIIIADDHPLFREGLRRIVQRVTPGKIVEVADNQSLLREAQREPAPSIMVLDLVFPGFEGARSIGQLREAYPQTAIVVVSMTDDRSVADQIMSAGANGYIAKSVPADTMASTISRILEGETIVCLEMPENAPSPEQDPLTHLPQRQYDVLVRVAQGKTNKEIARELDISPFTVRAHISLLFKSLGVTTRAAASAVAAQHGLV